VKGASPHAASGQSNRYSGTVYRSVHANRHVPGGGPRGTKGTQQNRADLPRTGEAQHLGSVVKLIVVLRANGTVKSTRVAGGSPLFIESAADAIRQWKLEPAREETTEVVQLVFEPR